MVVPALSLVFVGLVQGAAIGGGVDQTLGTSIFSYNGNVQVGFKVDVHLLPHPEELLADWPAALERFTEVIPRDFRIVMEAKAKAEADGLDENEIANAMMEALHG